MLRRSLNYFSLSKFTSPFFFFFFFSLSLSLYFSRLNELFNQFKAYCTLCCTKETQRTFLVTCIIGFVKFLIKHCVHKTERCIHESIAKTSSSSVRRYLTSSTQQAYTQESNKRFLNWLFRTCSRTSFLLLSIILSPHGLYILATLMLTSNYLLLELLLWNISNAYILNFIVEFSIALHAFRDHELQVDQITLHVLSHSCDMHPK